MHLGAFLPLTGSLSGIGAAVLDGQRAYWSYVNDDLGGVAGHFMVVLDEVDTAYDADTTAAALSEHDDGLLAISSSLGSPVTAVLLEGDGTLPIMVGSEASSWADHANAVFDLAVPTYRAQVAALWDSLSGGSVGFVAPEGDYGDDCLAGAGSPPDTVVRYPAGTTDFESTITRLEGVDALVACVTFSDLTRIIATWQLVSTPPPIFATAASFDPSIFAVLDTMPEHLSIAGGPPPYESDEPGVQLFKQNMGDTPVDQWTFLGYTQAATVHVLLEQAIADGSLTRAGILAARSQVGDVDFGFGWGPAGYVGNLPDVPVTISVPDPDAAFGLAPASP
jgi:hypothetical protein